MIRNNQNRRRRGGNNGGNSGPRPQQMNGGNNYGARLDNRQRGNASQLLEKYRALARDAQQAGDRVTAEYYLQYADHYYRVLGDYRDKAPADGRQRGREFYDDDNTGYAASNDDEGDSDDEQDGDRSDDRADGRGDGRGEDGRNWQGDRNVGRQREPRQETRQDTRSDNRDRAEPRSDTRDRTWNGNNAPRARDDSRPERTRDENRPDRARDESRPERLREENRPERTRDDSRTGNRERRPEAQRLAPVEAPLDAEGPIPGLPGPATLRMRRSEPSAPVEPAAPAPVVDTAEEVTVPRRRGRPRKIVDTAPVEG